MSEANPRRKHLWSYCTAAVLVSVLVSVSLILPAEYSLDPLGVGKWLGIKGMSNTTTVVADSQDFARQVSKHSASFTLEPFESLELKYLMNEHESMVYSWQSLPGEVVFELHSHPLDAAEDYADTYERQRSQSRSGLYQAEYHGLHGWFWENRGLTKAVVQVSVAGFFSKVMLYREGREEELDPDSTSELY